MKQNSESGAQLFFRIIDRLIFNEKNNILVYGDDLKLFPSEIHLVLMISNGKSESYNTIVRRLGVTKGAVSQTISRLAEKGVLEKKKGNTASDLTIVLTDLGKKVQKECRKIQKRMFEKFTSYLTSLPERDRKVIIDFLGHIETQLAADTPGTRDE